MADSEEELKSLLMKVKENEKAALKLNIKKIKIMASGPITSWQTDGDTMEIVTEFTFLATFTYITQSFSGHIQDIFIL